MWAGCEVEASLVSFGMQGSFVSQGEVSLVRRLARNVLMAGFISPAAQLGKPVLQLGLPARPEEKNLEQGWKGKLGLVTVNSIIRRPKRPRTQSFVRRMYRPRLHYVGFEAI